jgi:hypothetical protein
VAICAVAVGVDVGLEIGSGAAARIGGVTGAVSGVSWA